MTTTRDRAMAARWAEGERLAGREVSAQLERRVAGALARGGAWHLSHEEALRRLRIWSESQNLNRNRPPTPVLTQIIRSDETASSRAAFLGEEVRK